MVEFYKHPRMADGHLHVCKACHRKAVADRYYAHHEAHLARDRARNATPRRRAQLRASLRRHRDKRKRERWANGKVAYAVRTGKLVPMPCVRCGLVPTNAHHEDYDRPLAVVWLCDGHHGARHREIRTASDRRPP